MSRVRPRQNKDTLWRQHCWLMFPKFWLDFPRAQHLWRTQFFCPGHKMFLKTLKHFLCPRGAQQCCGRPTSQGTMLPSQCVLVLPGPNSAPCSGKDARPPHTTCWCTSNNFGNTRSITDTTCATSCEKMWPFLWRGGIRKQKLKRVQMRFVWKSLKCVCVFLVPPSHQEGPKCCAH